MNMIDVAITDTRKHVSDPALFNGSIEGALDWLRNSSYPSKFLSVWSKNDDLYMSVEQFLSRWLVPQTEPNDPVNHPSHYKATRGPEVIEMVRHMNFNRGNAVKYIARAGFKNPDTEIEDLQKAIWYLNDEIKRLQS